MGNSIKGSAQSGAEDLSGASGLTLLTDDEIQNRKIPKYELWFVLLKGEPKGPYHVEDIRNYLERNPSFPLETKVSNFVRPKWLPLFKFPEFQRRKTGRHTPLKKNAPENDLYILVNGQKEGPISLEDLLAKLKNREILFTDLMSVDHGQNWIHLYQHPQLDRRVVAHSKKDLPNSPEENVMDQVDQSDLEQIGNKKDQSQMEDSEQANDLFVGLAHMEKASSSGGFHTLEDIEEESHRDLAPEERPFWTRKESLWFSVFLPLLGIFGLLVYLRPSGPPPLLEEEAPSAINRQATEEKVPQKVIPAKSPSRPARPKPPATPKKALSRPAAPVKANPKTNQINQANREQEEINRRLEERRRHQEQRREMMEKAKKLQEEYKNRFPKANEKRPPSRPAPPVLHSRDRAPGQERPEDNLELDQDRESELDAEEREHQLQGERQEEEDRENFEDRDRSRQENQQERDQQRDGRSDEDGEEYEREDDYYEDEVNDDENLIEGGLNPDEDLFEEEQTEATEDEEIY